MSENRGPVIVVYTLDGCSKCAAFKDKLYELSIPYKEKNCSKSPWTANVLNLSAFPSIKVDDTLMGYSEAIEWLREQEV